jgi:DNA-binding NarL/FixJ family response regulator
MNVWGGYTAMVLGDLEAAWKRFEAGIETGRLWGAGERIDNVPASFIAQILLERGDVRGARAALDSVSSEIVHGAFAGNLWLRAEVEVLTAEGRLEEAEHGGRKLGELLGRMDNPAGHPWRTVLAEVLLRLDRNDEAAELALAELELAHAWGAPGPIGRALRVLGVARRDEGTEQLEEAVRVLEGSQARLELGKALAALGTATRLQRQPSEAREPLYRALEVANVCSATALEEHVRTELAATGARPRREALTGVGSLTPSEERVAALAAAGRSNREIAQELFVTPKTVEVHLSSTYRKLEIRGRRELPAALGKAAGVDAPEVKDG